MGLSEGEESTVESRCFAGRPLARGSENDFFLFEPQHSALSNGPSQCPVTCGRTYIPWGWPDSFHLQQHLQGGGFIANLAVLACGNRLSATDQGWRPRWALWGGQAALSQVCNFLRDPFALPVLSQVAFAGRLFFFFLFLVTFALIFIRKPVCGLPLSITQLLLLEFKNVYRPCRPVCVSPLMNWAPN